MGWRAGMDDDDDAFRTRPGHHQAQSTHLRCPLLNSEITRELSCLPGSPKSFPFKANDFDIMTTRHLQHYTQHTKPPKTRYLICITE